MVRAVDVYVITAGLEQAAGGGCEEEEDDAAGSLWSAGPGSAAVPLPSEIPPTEHRVFPSAGSLHLHPDLHPLSLQ